jgi:hypothetical protein
VDVTLAVATKNICLMLNLYILGFAIRSGAPLLAFHILFAKAQGSLTSQISLHNQSDTSGART